MGRHGEGLRFWLPVVMLFMMAVYSTQKLVRAHVDPEVEGNKYTFTRKLAGRRGTIYDACGRSFPLAKSIPVWEYRLDPVALTNRVVKRRGEPPRPPNAIAKTIANALGLEYRKVLGMCENVRSRYQFLAKSYDTETHRILCDRTLVAGVIAEDRQERKSTSDRNCKFAHVIGSVNAEGVGSAGIELRYNQVLTGVPGEITGMKDALGHEIYDKRITSIDPVPGADVHLTVDHNIQYEAESALAWGVKEFGAGSGWCIVLDAKTGAVLAMASLPDFDPWAFGRASDDERLNRAVGFVYEPGSVMKVITAAAAIDAGFVKPDSLYLTNRDDPNYYKLPGDGSHVWEPRMSVKDAIVHSSNIVIGKLGYDFGSHRLYEYMRAFGFGERTGIELPGEECGILPDPRKREWDKASRSRAAIGQFVAVTAIQLAGAYQAIANDGVRMRPYIVDRVIGADGRDIYRGSPRAVGDPVSARTARTMREVMLGVASPNGTARRAAIRGYSVAGKTGTAQKAKNGHYQDGLYRASFCGIVPSGTVPGHDPRLVVLVTLDFDTRTTFHQGGNSAAPVFKRIALGALRYLYVPPDRPDELDDCLIEDEFDRIVEERTKKYDIIPIP